MVPDGKKYLDYAEKILKSLSGDAYLAKVGENQKTKSGRCWLKRKSNF